MQATLKKIGRALLWVGAVLAAANVEKIGDTLGLTNLFAGSLWWLGWLVSPVTYALALVAIGVGLAAWADWLARKWDGMHPTADAQLAACWAEIRGLAQEFNRCAQRYEYPSMSLLSRTNSAYTTLRKRGLPCPEISSNDGPVWLIVNLLFAEALWPLLRDGHIAEAKEAGHEMIEAQEESVKLAKEAVEMEKRRNPYAWRAN